MVWGPGDEHLPKGCRHCEALCDYGASWSEKCPGTGDVFDCDYDVCDGATMDLRRLGYVGIRSTGESRRTLAW